MYFGNKDEHKSWIYIKLRSVIDLNKGRTGDVQYLKREESGIIGANFDTGLTENEYILKEKYL